MKNRDKPARKIKGNGRAPLRSSEARLRPFSRSLPMALLRARETVMRHFRPSLQAFDLTEQQWRVLRALAAEGEIDVTGLADATFLLAPSLTRILRDLENRKMIRRRADPNDFRAALISLTTRGRTIFDNVGLNSEQIYRAIELRLGESRMQTLMTMLVDVEKQLRAPLVIDGQAADMHPTPRQRRHPQSPQKIRSAREGFGT
jgi:homoprotocatechuate degradation regulator HpaR